MGNAFKALGPELSQFKLYIRGQFVSATPWPRIGLWKQRDDEWIELLPQLALNQSALMAEFPTRTMTEVARYLQIDEKECRRNVSVWLATVPDNVLEEARRYGRQGYRMLRLFSVGGETALAFSRGGNDALCIILANSESFLETATPLSPESAAELLTLKRSELLSALGFPAGDESERLLRRTDFGDLGRSPRPFLLMLRRAMTEPETRRLLATHSTINERSLVTLLLTMNAMESLG